jgi:hypothetical protein
MVEDGFLVVVGSGRRLNVVFSLLFSQALHMPVDVAKSGSYCIACSSCSLALRF